MFLILAQATPPIVEAGGILLVIGSLTLVIVGLAQFISSLLKGGDKTRAEIFDKLEAEKLENVRLQGQLFLYEAQYKQMKAYARKYYKLYKRHEDLALLKAENTQNAIQASVESVVVAKETLDKVKELE